MPVAKLRLAVSKQKLTRDMTVDWKFYGELPASNRTGPEPKAPGR